MAGGAGQAAGIIGAEQARISGQTGISSILGQETLAGLSNLFKGEAAGGLAPGGGSIVNINPITAPTGGGFLNVPLPGSFTGGFPALPSGGGLTFGSSLTGFGG